MRFELENALSLVTPYDIVVDCSDNFNTKYLINDACVKAEKPFVAASVLDFKGQLAVFNYQNSATLRCLFPDLPEENAAPNCAENGVLGVVPGTLGVLQANEVIKLACGIGKPLVNRLMILDLLNHETSYINFAADVEQVECIKGANLVYIKEQKENSDCNRDKMPNSFKEISAVDYSNFKDAHTLLDVREDSE